MTMVIPVSTVLAMTMLIGTTNYGIVVKDGLCINDAVIIVCLVL